MRMVNYCAYARLESVLNHSNSKNIVFQRFANFLIHPVQGESKKTDTFVIHLNIKCISFF
jgi:hypothetical protein